MRIAYGIATIIFVGFLILAVASNNVNGVGMALVALTVMVLGFTKETKERKKKNN